MILIDEAKERAKPLVQSTRNFPKNMKVTKSYWKDTAAVWEILTTRLSCLATSDFPSFIYAHFYSTKRKSAKNASDSSRKLISYSSIFASNFWIVVALAVLTVINITGSSIVISHNQAYKSLTLIIVFVLVAPRLLYSYP